MAFDPSKPVSIGNPITGGKGVYSAFDADGNPTEIVVNGQSVPISTMPSSGVYATDGSQAFKAQQTGGKLMYDSNNNQPYYQNADGTTSTYWDASQPYNFKVTYTPNAQETSPVAGPGNVAPTPTGVPASVLTQPASISNPVAPPTTNSASFTPPTPGAPATLDTFNTSVAGNVAATTAQLDAAYNSQIKSYQDQITALTQKQTELQQLQDEGMLDLKSTVLQETQKKQAALDLEMKQFQENYEANQKLVSELDGLLTTGNQIIEQMKATTGLDSIMSPRISQTMSDVAARAGVIQAVLAARNNQIGVAQNQLKSSLDALSSIYNDQISYYKSVVAFYEQQKGDNQDQINLLTKDEQTYINAKIGMLQDAQKNAQATADIIQKAMLNPSTALAYAEAGVTLNDTPQQIGQKLAVYAYHQELVDLNNKMAGSGYSTQPITGVTPVQIADSQGQMHNYYKESTSTQGYTLGTNQVRFDAQGNVIASGPSSASATKPPQGQTTSSSTTPPAPAQMTTTLAGLQGGKTFSNGSFQFSPDQYQQAQSILTSTTVTDAKGNPNMGADGYVNPQVYLDLLGAWNKAGGLTSDFLTIFPVKKYVNPANSWPQIVALGGGTKPKTTTSSSSSSGGSSAQLP